MSKYNLGRLEKVDLRNVWTSESDDFTPWLAKQYNLELLGETIGIELELEAQEKNVGPFRADILCKDTANDNWVLIENQLERTDHTHLGQLLTYASGLKAVTIVWISKRFTEEHRSALDWLNEITDDRFNFFGLEVELWKIGESQIAPKFNMVSKPNDWSKTVSASTAQVRNEALTDKRIMQRDFWQAFYQYAKENSTVIKPTKPFPQHWMTIAIGKSGVKLSAIASMYDSKAGSYDGHEVRVELTFDDDNAKNYFSQIEAEKDKIESEIGQEVYWHNPQDKKSSRLYIRKPTDLNNKDNWPKELEWLLTNLELFYKVFHNRVKNLHV